MNPHTPHPDENQDPSSPAPGSGSSAVPPTGEQFPDAPPAGTSPTVPLEVPAGTGAEGGTLPRLRRTTAPHPRPAASGHSHFSSGSGASGFTADGTGGWAALPAALRTGSASTR